MIDIISERLVTLTQAARSLPRLRSDRPVSPSTVWRWTRAGLRGVRLEVVKLGGTTVTSAEALQRFFAAINGTPMTSRLNRAAHDSAVERELSSRGV